MRLLGYIVLFVVVTYAELRVTVYAVPHLIGAPATVALLVASSMLGVALLKRESRAVWARFKVAIGSGRLPNEELIDGVLVVFGGALLIVPGFVTDVIGLLLLVPITRPLARRIVQRSILRRGLGALAGSAQRGGRGRGGRARPDVDVEGSATEYGYESPPDAGAPGTEARPRQLRH